jgi:ABC-type bacteriocin/lantibiotic exporter with double-glycine peptidase domain
MKLEIFESRTLLANPSGDHQNSWEGHTIEHEDSTVEIQTTEPERPISSLISNIAYYTATITPLAIGSFTSMIIGFTAGQLVSYSTDRITLNSNDVRDTLIGINIGITIIAATTFAATFTDYAKAIILTEIGAGTLSLLMAISAKKI